MHAILILTIIATLLLLPGAGAAETNAECQTRCAVEKATRDAACPPSDQDEDTDRARLQCLQDSENAFNGCVSGCPPPEPADTQEPPQQ